MNKQAKGRRIHKNTQNLTHMFILPLRLSLSFNRTSTVLLFKRCHNAYFLITKVKFAQTVFISLTFKSKLQQKSHNYVLRIMQCNIHCLWKRILYALSLAQKKMACNSSDFVMKIKAPKVQNNK